MAEKVKRSFRLIDLPDYKYPLNVACPECYAPLESRTRKDGRCDKCLHSKDVLPVNFIRVKKRDEDDEDDEHKARRYNRDE